MARPKKKVEVIKKVVDTHIINNVDVEPVKEQVTEPIKKIYIKDRIQLTANQDVNFMGYIQLEKDVPLTIAPDIFENIKAKIPTFRQMLENGIIKVK